MYKAICLDTRALSRYLIKNRKIVELVDQFMDEGYEIYTTTINVSELMMGTWKIGPISEERMSMLKSFFKELNVRPLDMDAAVVSGRLFGDVLRGNEIGWRDTFIASIVLENGKKIITSNARHFNRIPDIEIIGIS